MKKNLTNQDQNNLNGTQTYPKSNSHQIFPWIYIQTKKIYTFKTVKSQLTRLHTGFTGIDYNNIPGLEKLNINISLRSYDKIKTC